MSTDIRTSRDRLAGRGAAAGLRRRRDAGDRRLPRLHRRTTGARLRPDGGRSGLHLRARRHGRGLPAHVYRAVPGSPAVLLSQLDDTVPRHPTVTSAEYRIQDGCTTPGATALVGTHCAVVACVGRCPSSLNVLIEHDVEDEMSTTGTEHRTRTKDAAREFLAHRRIAVTGVSRTPGSHGSNAVYRRLRDRGYDVVAVNPNATNVEGDQCWPDLRSVPGSVDAVVIGTRPERAAATVEECVELRIGHVWMHRSVDAGSVSPEAAARARQAGIQVIDGGCPCMFGPAADPGHRIMKSVLTLTGAVPRRV